MTRPAVTKRFGAGMMDQRPWPQAEEISKALPARSWTLIGCGMVQLHSLLKDLPPTRATTDVDAALHLETGVISFSQTAVALAKLGYQLDERQQFAYRFFRDAETVDVLCSDRFAATRKPQYQGRPLFGVPGGTRALHDTINVRIQHPGGTFDISLPSARGALILKGAAFIEDSRDRQRHLSDGVALLACLENLDHIFDGLSGRSRKRIRAIARAARHTPSVWNLVDTTTRARAEEALVAIGLT